MAEVGKVLRRIMKGELPEEEVVQFLTQLREKGETETDLFEAVQVLREFEVRVNFPQENLVDTCGTGGDGKGTFNISTAAAFVVAGAGVRVAKHGNRAVSSQAGSADLLEALGVKIDCDPMVVRRSLQETGFGFFFAPLYHPAMKNVASARKKVGRTLFNLLGPLLNPTQPLYQVVGIYDKSRMLSYAKVLHRIGVQRAWVVHSAEGMDEISLTGNTFVVELNEGGFKEMELDPRDYGFSLCKISDLQGRDAAQNATVLKGILEGYLCPLREAIVLNAAAALLVVGRVARLGEGITLAQHSLDQGKAHECLRKLVEVTNG